MEKTDWTINHAMLPRSTFGRPEKLLKQVTSKVGDPVPVCSNLDSGTVAGRRRSVLYEI